MAAYSENQFENDLISYLTTGEVGMRNGYYREKIWKYEPDIKTTEQLWDNFKRILERHNQDKLDKPLSETEFNQIKQEISKLSTPYKAGQFLYGTNGVSELEVDMDDGRHVFLKVFDQSQVGGGDTVYQVVNQIQRPAKIIGKGDCRFDVTLLMNGLPIIQIEEKTTNHEVYEALNQMERYAMEGQYGDIFSTLQILIAMTPYDARYMANMPADRFNKDFAFQWQDKKTNTPVRNWKEFADAFLSIPMAHRMSTNYMILDGTKNKESIKVMRPYQVYATESVIDGVKLHDFDFGDNKIGYIWHTTGSGKTITSFKTAWLASRLPNIDKVVFVVDRTALTEQTAESYKAYDPDASAFSLGNVRDVANTNDLERKLKSKDNGIVITSFQKLLRLVGREKFKAPNKNILFIVDEAHRSVNGEAFRRVKKAFPRGAWVGYTGTPVFNSKEDSTEERFGELLHAYTIREAIADKNVLGFKVSFETTLDLENIDSENVKDYFRQKYPDMTDQELTEAVNNFQMEKFDDEVGQAFYDYRQDHIQLVVEDIFKHWKNRSNEGRFNAILTTHASGTKPSIPMATQYLEEIMRVNETLPEEKRLKVGATFSRNDTNNDSMNDDRKCFEKALEIYNKQFGTNYTEDQEDDYRADFASRLNKTNDDGNFLDIAIVVDRLLTGFDAPELNTLYVDRLLKGADLIQAYSRTNRLFDRTLKPWGNIVNYRTPVKAEELMNDALSIYSNRGSADLTGSGDKVDPIGPIVAKPFEKQVEDVTKIVEKLKEFTDNFKILPPSEADLEEALSTLRSYSIGISKLKQYDEYDYDHPEELLKKLGMNEDMENQLNSIGKEIRREVARRKNVPVFEIDLEMTHIKDVKVNYDYLTELIEKLMNQVHEDKMDLAEETRRKIIQFADSVDNPEYAKLIRKAAEAIFSKQYPGENSGMKYPVKLKNCDEIIQSAYDTTLGRRFIELRKRWGITEVINNKEMKKFFSTHKYGQKDLDDTGWLTEILKEAAEDYKTLADEDIQTLTKIKYRNQLRQALYAMADELAAES